MVETEVKTVRKLVVTVDPDDSPDCPMDWDGQWKLYSFNTDSIHYRDPEEFLRRKGDGKIVPASPGLRRKMEVGLAFLLQYYEHSLGRYDIQGSGPQCEWDTTQYGGILVWEHKPQEMGAKTPAHREKDAEAFLETYNNWMNGWVYCYSIETAGGELIDSCCGYYELDYLTATINEHLAEGDQVVLKGLAKDLLTESELNAEVVDSHDDE